MEKKSLQKAPWDISRLAKADRKTIHNLYATRLQVETMKSKVVRDVLSQMTGMKDFNQLLKDIHQNPLLSKAPKFEVPTIMNPSDVIGSYIYERFQGILRSLAWFSTIFTHMDWSRFAAISQERQKITMSSQNPEETQYPPVSEEAGLSQTLDQDRPLDNIIPFDLDSL